MAKRGAVISNEIFDGKDRIAIIWRGAFLPSPLVGEGGAREVRDG
jgi:hypothetical protein